MRLFVTAVPDLEAANRQSALRWPGVSREQGPAVVVLAVGEAPGESPVDAAERIADAASAAMPWAVTYVACGANSEFFERLVQTLAGAPDRSADIRLGEVHRGLLTGASATGAGLAVVVRGVVDEALLVRRAATPPGATNGPDAMLGQRIAGRYELVSRLGAGGMGVVYRARQLGMDRDVAVKVLGTALAADERAVARFRREAKLLSRLRHPNLVTVYEFGETDGGLAYIAMELLEGQPVSELLSGTTPLPVDRVVGLFDQVCAALEAAHSRGIIHRDLKPENLFVERLPDGTEHLRVLDFGLARSNEGGSVLTANGAVMGTPAYMAPEQVRGEHNDTRTDLYQLGAVLYHLLSGRRPFQGPNALSVMMQHLTAEPAPLGVLRPEVPPELAALAAALLRKSPPERPQSVGEVRVRLVGLRARAPAPVPAASPEVLAVDADIPPPVRALPARTLAAVGLALAFAVFGYVATRTPEIETTLDEAPRPAAAASDSSAAAPPLSAPPPPPSAVARTEPPVTAPTIASERPPRRPTPATSPAPRGHGSSVDDALERELSGMTR